MSFSPRCAVWGAHNQPETVFVPSTYILKEREEMRPNTCTTKESLLGPPSHSPSRTSVRMSFGINQYTVAKEDRPPHGISLGAASRTFAGATTSHRKMSERAPGASHSFQTQASRRNIKAPADSFKYAVLLLTKLLNDAASAPLIQEQGSSSRLLLRWSSAGRGKHKPDPTNLWISPADGCSST